MEYLDYTQEDATKDGIEYTVSMYSKKIVDESRTVGAIIFQDKKLNLIPSFINNSKNEEARCYYESLNNANSLLLRRIYFSKDKRYSGELETLFDYITSEIIPHDFIIWCNDNSPLKDYIKQIGGFNKPLHEIPNKSILLFSINL